MEVSFLATKMSERAQKINIKNSTFGNVFLWQSNAQYHHEKDLVIRKCAEHMQAVN